MILSSDFTEVSAEGQAENPEQARAKEALHLPDLREGTCYLVRFHVGKGVQNREYLDVGDIYKAMEDDPESGQVGPYFDSASGVASLRFTKPLGVLRTLEMAGEKGLKHDPPRIGRFFQ